MYPQKFCEETLLQPLQINFPSHTHKTSFCKTLQVVIFHIQYNITRVNAYHPLTGSDNQLGKPRNIASNPNHNNPLPR